MNQYRSTAARFFQARRDGFTMLELAIVLTIAGILAGFAVPSFTTMRRNKAAQNARDAFVWMSARAKATAIERGTTYLLEIDPATDRGWIVLRRTSGPALPADTLQTVNYTGEFEAAISTATNTKITLCYNTRGYAWPCSVTNSPMVNTDITFSHGDQIALARVKVLGQVERL